MPIDPAKQPDIEQQWPGGVSETDAAIKVSDIGLPNEESQYADVIMDIVREPLVLLDSDLRVLRITPSFCEAFLLSPDEVQGRLLQDLGNDEWNDRRLRDLLNAALFDNRPFRDYRLHHESPHIGRRTLCLNGRRVPGPHPEMPFVLLAVEDVTERPEVAEAWFRRIFETAKDGIMVVDIETETVADINPWFLWVTGYQRDEIVGKKLSELEPLSSCTVNPMQAIRAAEMVRFDELPVRKKAGGMITAELIANVYNIGTRRIAQLNFRDVTLRKEEQEILRRSLEEKALLVREIHHRVKNNLQVIVSLLSLQAAYTRDVAAIAAFEEMERRVRAIARIHETLYASTDLAQIEFATYLSNLTQELVSFYQHQPDAITLELDTEDMVLQMEQAIPLGLIANELILNALKHGLKSREGRLSVSLRYRRDEAEAREGRSLDEGWAQLEVRDDGPGLPNDIDLRRVRSMGFRLLNLLVTQLRGEVAFLPGPGANVRVDFPLFYPMA